MSPYLPAARLAWAALKARLRDARRPSLSTMILVLAVAAWAVVVILALCAAGGGDP